MKKHICNAVAETRQQLSGMIKKNHRKVYFCFIKKLLLATAPHWSISQAVDIFI